MRGWWADEKLESGNWDSLIFKYVYKYFLKRKKRFFLKKQLIKLFHLPILVKKK